jgi:Skp family chaperone for outer membrane proteins
MSDLTITAPSISTLKALFPSFQSYTGDQLRAMNSDQLVAVLQNLAKVRDTLSSETVKCETNLAAIQQQIEQVQAAIKAEFSVSSLEELEKLQQETISLIEAQYVQLGTAITTTQS